MGATGSGKSTLLRSATGLASALPGTGVTGSFSTNARATGYVPQDALDGFLSFDAVNEFVLRLRALGRSLPEAHQEAQRRLTVIQLAERATVPLHRLSGGERRRLALAAAQVHDPDVLLLDEPFNHVDSAWRPRLAIDIGRAALRRLVVVATHDPSPWQEDSPRTLLIRDGRLHHDGPADGFDPARFPEIAIGPTAPWNTSPRAATPRLEFQAVTCELEGTRALEEVTLDLGPGLHALVGPNGAGKTTFLRAAAGLIRPQSGRIRANGLDTRAATGLVHHVALQFEEPTSAFFASTLRQELAFAPTNQGLPGCDIEARLREAISDFELDAFMDRHPYTLSGGQKQRLALASVQATQAPIILLDEPTQGLDAANRRLLHAFLERQATDRCIVAATHDEGLIGLAHDVTRLCAGRIEAAPREVTLRTPS